jgi:hypothetical protein
MKDKLLIRLAGDQDTLIAMLKKCPPHGDKMDLLQDFYLFCFEKHYALLNLSSLYPKGKLNKGLVFIMLKNFVLGEIRKDKTNLRRQEVSNKFYHERLTTEADEFSSDNNLAYEYNMMILTELTKELTNEEYQHLLKLSSNKLLSEFRDKDGSLNMPKYKATVYQLTKRMNNIKKTSVLFQYLTVEEIDSFDTFTKLEMNFNNKHNI